VWVVETPATPERVLRALEARGTGPRREGKSVIFDEDLSIAAVADSRSTLLQLGEGDIGSGLREKEERRW
jgi:hypothetical protein